MKKIVYLGPFGTTFTHDARVYFEQKDILPRGLEYVPAGNNADVLNLAISKEGYAVLAMETLAERRVTPSLESFIHLLALHGSSCPVQIVGAVALPLHFCLMARPSVSREAVSGIVSHAKSFGACREALKELSLPLEEVASNGEATRLVAEDEKYATRAALGPRSAADHYDLVVLDAAFEALPAVTTFVAVAPRNSVVPFVSSDTVRAMLVFEVPHEPGALVKVQIPLAEEGINMTSIHSVGHRDYDYHFGIEVMCQTERLSAFERALAQARGHTTKSVLLGPYPLLCG